MNPRLLILAAILIFKAAFLPAAGTNVFLGSGDSTGAIPIADAYGRQLAQDNHLNGAGLDVSEIKIFTQGFSEGCKERHPPFAALPIFPDVQALAAARQEKVFRAIEVNNATASARFLQHWRIRAKVFDLDDDVHYEIIRPGNGSLPKPNQTVRVHYFARLVNGAGLVEFGPDDLILVTNHLNPGLFAGFQKIGRGGSIRLFLPPALAAHQVEMAGAPRGSALVYEIEMLDIKDTAPDDLAAALVPAAPDPPPPGYSGKFPTNEVIEAWGWQIAQQARLSNLMLGDAELTALVKGFEAGVRGAAPADDIQRMRPAVEKFEMGRREQSRAAFRQKQIEDMNNLFAKLKDDPEVVTLPDGLRYKILQAGNGPFPQNGQIVLVDYTAKLIDGRIFDQTTVEPLHVEVGRVIPGWSEGIQKIARDGKIRLYIPPSLGYGSKAVSGIPADSTLIYDIDLKKIEAPAR